VEKVQHRRGRRKKGHFASRGELSEDHRTKSKRELIFVKKKSSSLAEGKKTFLLCRPFPLPPERGGLQEVISPGRKWELPRFPKRKKNSFHRRGRPMPPAGTPKKRGERRCLRGFLFTAGPELKGVAGGGEGGRGGNRAPKRGKYHSFPGKEESEEGRRVTQGKANKRKPTTPLRGRIEGRKKKERVRHVLKGRTSTVCLKKKKGTLPQGKERSCHPGERSAGSRTERGGSTIAHRKGKKSFIPSRR